MQTERVKQEQQKLEEQKLQEFVAIIQENLKSLREEKVWIDKTVKQLFDSYTKGDRELYSDLMVAINNQGQITHALEANESAENKPHFGRVDYYDHKNEKNYSLYIGKHGISSGPTEIVIVDWRAAAASIYYECNTGESSYQVPTGEQIPIRLDLKRTFDIEKKKLIGFYDSDTAANDELLIKYLAKNKDAVLGEIIATIQQEQNQIIRERHNRNLIVQGVAGSGKTTVAVHRISYLLYNFSDKYAPEEFCIIGSNDMLLNYITSALPSLDVHNTKQYRMEQLFLYFLQEYLPENKYQPYESGILTALKSSYVMAKWVEEWTAEEQERLIPREDVLEKGEVLFEKRSMDQYLNLFSSQSIVQKIENLNTRLAAKIKLVYSEAEPPVRKEILKKYRKYFGRNYKKRNALQLYLDFLLWLKQMINNAAQTNILQKGAENKTAIIQKMQESRQQQQVLQEKELDAWIANVKKGRLDIYDLASMTLLAYGWLRTEEEKGFGQIIIDEAQDFGVLVYYVLHRMIPNAVYMIMGDVSQNIHFDSGMNDWKDLRTYVFNNEQDRFYTLCKSYRNTIEISAYASRILEKTSFETYPIEPIVRHGEPVEVYCAENEKQMTEHAKSVIEKTKEKGYDTIAVICRNEKEADQVRKSLGADNDEIGSFQKGVLVLPIFLTKGLEFDSVLIWNPNKERYQESDADAKLLYVAVTRALHELHLLYCGNLCGLLEDKLQ